jgi:hypothetical protein
MGYKIKGLNFKILIKILCGLNDSNLDLPSRGESEPPDDKIKKNPCVEYPLLCPLSLPFFGRI